MWSRFFTEQSALLGLGGLLYTMGGMHYVWIALHSFGVYV
jgi:hypothetical protein